MIDLTQQILALDNESETTLKNALLAEQKTKREADALAEKIKKEKQLLFEEQKRTETALLVQKMKVARQSMITALHLKMERFDAEVSIDKIAKQLLEAARDRVCR